MLSDGFSPRRSPPDLPSGPPSPPPSTYAPTTETAQYADDDVPRSLGRRGKRRGKKGAKVNLGSRVRDVRLLPSPSDPIPCARSAHLYSSPSTSPSSAPSDSVIRRAQRSLLAFSRHPSPSLPVPSSRQSSPCPPSLPSHPATCSTSLRKGVARPTASFRTTLTSTRRGGSGTRSTSSRRSAARRREPVVRASVEITASRGIGASTSLLSLVSPSIETEVFRSSVARTPPTVVLMATVASSSKPVSLTPFVRRVFVQGSTSVHCRKRRRFCPAHDEDSRRALHSLAGYPL